MFRIMAHVLKRAGEPWVEWHIPVWRQRQVWMLLKEASLRSARILCQAAQQWEAWTVVYARCVLARAVYLHLRLYTDQAQDLFFMVGLARTTKNGRQGRPPGR